MSEQKKYEEVGEVGDLPDNIFEWLGRNYDKITPEQREKIFRIWKRNKNKIIGEMSYLKCRDIERTAVSCSLAMKNELE